MLSVKYNNHVYSVDNKGDILIICIDGIEKAFKLKRDMDYVYQIKKTFVKCQSPEHLMKHFEFAIKEDFAVHAWFVAPLEKIFNYTKCLETY